MTLVNGVTVLSWSTWWGRYLPAGSSVQERPPTLSHAPVCLPTLTLPSLHRSHVWAVDLTQPCSLCFLSSMSIFHLRVCPDTPCPMWPVFLECHLPAVFLVSSFSFGISQDNHFFSQSHKGKLISVPTGYSVEIIHLSPKLPLGSNWSLALLPSSSNAALCHGCLKEFGDLEQCWLCLPPTRLPQLGSCWLSQDGKETTQ